MPRWPLFVFEAQSERSEVLLWDQRSKTWEPAKVVEVSAERVCLFVLSAVAAGNPIRDETNPGNLATHALPAVLDLSGESLDEDFAADPRSRVERGAALRDLQELRFHEDGMMSRATVQNLACMLSNRAARLRKLKLWAVPSPEFDTWTVYERMLFMSVPALPTLESFAVRFPSESLGGFEDPRRVRSWPQTLLQNVNDRFRAGSSLREVHLYVDEALANPSESLRCQVSLSPVPRWALHFPEELSEAGLHAARVLVGALTSNTHLRGVRLTGHVPPDPTLRRDLARLLHVRAPALEIIAIQADNVDDALVDELLGPLAWDREVPLGNLSELVVEAAGDPDGSCACYGYNIVTSMMDRAPRLERLTLRYTRAASAEAVDNVLLQLRSGLHATVAGFSAASMPCLVARVPWLFDGGVHLIEGPGVEEAACEGGALEVALTSMAIERADFSEKIRQQLKERLVTDLVTEVAEFVRLRLSVELTERRGSTLGKRLFGLSHSLGPDVTVTVHPQ